MCFIHNIFSTYTRSTSNLFSSIKYLKTYLLGYFLSRSFSVFFVYTNSGCRNSLVHHSFHLASTLSFSVFHSVRAESTKTTWQLLPEDRYNQENNLAACTKTKTQFDRAQPNRHGPDLILHFTQS